MPYPSPYANAPLTAMAGSMHNAMAGTCSRFTVLRLRPPDKLSTSTPHALSPSPNVSWAAQVQAQSHASDCGGNYDISKYTTGENPSAITRCQNTLRIPTEDTSQ